MKPSFKFYDRKGYVQIRINAGYQKMRKTTGIESTNFDGHSRIKGRTPYADSANKLLRELEEAVTNATDFDHACRQVNYLLNADKKEKGDAPDATLSAFINQYIEEEASKLSQSTKYLYESMQRTYSEFAEDQGDIEPVDVDLSQILIKHRPEVIRSMNAHFQSYANFLFERGMKVSSQVTYLRKLIAVINWIKKSYGIEIPGQVPIKKAVYDSVALPSVIVKKFMQMDKWYENDVKMSVYLLAKIQMCTTWRQIDAIRMRKSDVIMHEGVPYITKITSKGGRKTINRLHPVVWEEIRKKGFGTNIYCDKLLMYKRAMQILSVNTYLREIFSEIPEMHEEVAITEQRPDGSIHRVNKKYIDLLTSHVLRKSAITYYNYEGVREKHIKMSSGHSANSASYKEVYDVVIGTALEREMGDAQDSFFK